MEMEEGGKLFFDLFVAMCNHIDDISERYVSFPSSRFSLLLLPPLNVT